VKGKLDKQLLIITTLLVIVGMIMIYSATSVMCVKNEKINRSTFYLIKQLKRVLIAAVGFVLALFIDYRLYRKYALVLLTGAAVLMLAIQIPQLTGHAKGASRWLELADNASIQPSELAKLALLLFLADYLAKRQEIMGDFLHSVLPAVAIVGVVVGIIAQQPNYGMAVAISMIAGVMFFAGGVRISHLVYITIPALGVIVYGIMHSQHAFQRVETYLAGGDPLKDAFQINQSLIAIGAGGFTGKGLGRSMQKMFYIPEIHTDFVFAVLGEELGFIGGLSILVLFILFAWRGLRISMRAPDRFGQLLAVGITAMIFIYALLNIGVVIGLLPTTGIPLPFISYGGSALLVNMIACGVLLNISSATESPLDKKLKYINEGPLRGIHASIDGGWRNRWALDPGDKHSTGTVGSPSENKNTVHWN